MSCTYCSLGKDSPLPYRRRSVDSVMEEIDRAVAQLGVGFIDFEDENLTLNKQWGLDLFKRLASAYGSRNLELRAMNGLFPSAIDEEMVVAMKQAGFKTLNLSLGSAGASQLADWKRPNVIADFDHALKWAEKHGLSCVTYIIAGAPNQSPDQTLEDLCYLAAKRTIIGLSVFYPAPGSYDFEILKTYNLLPSPCSLYRSSAIPISHTTTRLESVTFLRLSRIVNFIKSLLDKGLPLPSPRPFHDDRTITDKDPISLGSEIVSGFLNDGCIRGVTPAGKIYKHQIDRTISISFINKYNLISWRGTV